MKTTTARFLPAFLSLLLISSAHAQPGASDLPTYKTGYSTTQKLGLDLYEALDSKYQPLVHVQPVFWSTEVKPYAQADLYDGDEKWPVVFISAGFVDLMNNIAHAKAIDRIEKGYFEKYVLSLAGESGDQWLKELPNLSNPKYWSDQMMDEQLSNWNQMVGSVLAIKLAHHYLGQFKKNENLLSGDLSIRVPINSVLTTAEWEAAFKAGVQHALDCGLAGDGLKALYDAIDKMPKRPQWTSYFLHEKVSVSRLKRDLDRLEDRFFGLAP